MVMTPAWDGMIGASNAENSSCKKISKRGNATSDCGWEKEKMDEVLSVHGKALHCPVFQIC